MAPSKTMLPYALSLFMLVATVFADCTTHSFTHCADGMCTGTIPTRAKYAILLIAVVDELLQRPMYLDGPFTPAQQCEQPHISPAGRPRSLHLRQLRRSLLLQQLCRPLQP